MRRRQFVALLGSVSAFGATERPARASETATAIELPEGRSSVEIEVPSASFVTIAIVGPQAALLGVHVLGSGPVARRLRASSPIEEDGLLPRMMSVRTRGPEHVELIVDVLSPVVVNLVAEPLDHPGAKPDATPTSARPLVGVPVPGSLRDGYQLLSAGRYAFARIDVVTSLLGALASTQRRFPIEPIGISEATQWNGRRPKSDRSEVRHISHDGGSDIDLALPASDTFASTVRDHCRRVWLDPTHAGCAAGTVKGVDIERLTLLLGLLCDEAPGRILKIIVDDEYRREIVRVAPSLIEKKWLGSMARDALAEDGIVVASPWHTDHVHVRFSGEKGRAPFMPEAP